MKPYYTILFLLLFQTGHVPAQNLVKDSLYNVLQNAIDDSAKYKVKTLLTDFYIEKIETPLFFIQMRVLTWLIEIINS